MPLENSSPASTKRASRRANQPMFAMVMVCLLFVAGVLAYSILYFGLVEGQEFAPDSFTRRKFTFYEIPLLGLQISPLQRQDVTNSLESHLISSQLIADLKTADEKKRWDLVIAERGAIPDARRLISQGEARILCEYLDAVDGKKESVWLNWTKQNPLLAKVLWPAVAKVARQELYIFAPDLLVLARNVTDPVKLPLDLDKMLTEKYLAFGLWQQQVGQHEAAVELFSEAFALSPGRSEILVSRAKSWASLGQSQKAADDLAQVKRLGVERP